MPLFISSLNSGSNANCYYIGNATEGVLVDAGLSCRETEKRMNRLGLEMSRVKAIFVSHEHADHITGIPGLSKKYNLPVYFTTATFRNSQLPVREELVRYFRPGEQVAIGELRINAFGKHHDAIDPHSFVVADDRVKVGVLTDIGCVCERVIRSFRECNAVFLESNYCETMLANGNYPYHLKRRISGDKGHLSNHQALELFLRHRGPGLSHLVLSHLSKNNNSPQVVEDLFRPHANGTLVHVASRYQESPLFELDGSLVNGNRLPALPTTTSRPEQLSLF